MPISGGLRPRWKSQVSFNNVFKCLGVTFQVELCDLLEDIIVQVVFSRQRFEYFLVDILQISSLLSLG